MTRSPAASSAAEQCFNYLAADGTLIYQVIRRPPKKFLQRRPGDNGRWINNLDGVERVPYRFPELREAIASDGEVDVLVLEGEKDVDRARQIGLVATTNAGGAGWPWPEAWSGYLRGAHHVYVLCDNDLAGLEAGRARAKLLANAGLDVYLVDVLAGLEETKGGDLSDYLDRLADEQLSADEQRERLWADICNVAERARAGSASPDDDSPAESLPDCGVDSEGIWRRDGKDKKQLANFGARIVAEVVLDDGAVSLRRFEIEATLAGRMRRFQIPVESFDEVRSWSLMNLGARAICRSGRDTARVLPITIQEISAAAGITERHVYRHTGWRETDLGEVFLHAGGAIGANGAVSSVEVDLPVPLQRFRLPDPPQHEELASAVRASLRLFDVGPGGVTVPQLGAVYRAALGPTDFSLLITGRSGVFKTSLAAVFQGHFGCFEEGKLPLGWDSTANFLGEMRFHAKDVLLGVDDFKPEGSRRDQDRLHGAGAQVLRSQGNGTTRGRLDRSSSMRPERPPRCMLLSTGESVPRGESVRARAIVVDVESGDIDIVELTRAQGEAHLHRAAMAGYLAWLARLGRPEWEARLSELSAKWRQLLDDEPAVHRRSPRAAAELAAGLELLFQFACDVGALASCDVGPLRDRVDEAFRETVRRQREHQSEESPAVRFLGLLAAALSRGQAHLVNAGNADAPPSKHCAALGWWASDRDRTIERHGRPAGWADTENAFLHPARALLAADEMAQAGGQPIGMTAKALGRELFGLGALAITDPTRGSVYRKTIQGERQDVWVVSLETLLRADALSETIGISGISGHDGSTGVSA